MTEYVGPRDGDLVRWRASVDEGFQEVRTVTGGVYPISVRQATVTLTLQDLSAEEMKSVIALINVMRGGPDVSIANYAIGSGQIVEPAKELMPKEPPRLRDRFEGLDI